MACLGPRDVRRPSVRRRRTGGPLGLHGCHQSGAALTDEDAPGADARPRSDRAAVGRSARRRASGNPGCVTAAAVAVAELQRQWFSSSAAWLALVDGGHLAAVYGLNSRIVDRVARSAATSSQSRLLSSVIVARVRWGHPRTFNRGPCSRLTHSTIERLAGSGSSPGWRRCGNELPLRGAVSAPGGAVSAGAGGREGPTGPFRAFRRHAAGPAGVGREAGRRPGVRRGQRGASRGQGGSL